MTTRSYQSGQRARAAAETRERILDAAVKVLDGADAAGGFSLESVAKAAGITRLTVYNQFGSRRALLEAAFDRMAMDGGLHRIRDAMSDTDPQAGLQHLITIFCDFWHTHGVASRRLLDAAVGDQELVDGLRARNERRRQALSVLVGRMAQRGDVRAGAARELVDVLFALTGAQLFAELKIGRRSTRRVCQLIQRLAADSVRRASE